MQSLACPPTRVNPPLSAVHALDAVDARQMIRDGEWTGHTSGLATRHVQGNLVVLPASYAHDFLLYCQRNPRPCPLLAVSEPGSAALPELGENLDIRTDVPLYRVWRHGQLVEEVRDVRSLWREDLVTFVLGCSFSFEHALLDAGVPLRHVAQSRNVAMFRTSIATEAAGPFAGPMVVTMRPFKPADAIRAVQITSRFPGVHGAPVHIGKPELIGIRDITRPDYGDPVELLDDELPVFWACGVTPQAAVMQARPSLCITHAPGFMLVTDLLNYQLATL